MSKITSYALAAGTGQLPFMVSLLVLVVLELMPNINARAEESCRRVSTSFRHKEKLVSYDKKSFWV